MTFEDCYRDNWLLIMGLIFESRAKGETFKARTKLILELHDFAAEHNDGDIDWGNLDQGKCSLNYDYKSRLWLVHSGVNYRFDFSLPYFSDSGLARKAISHFGDRLNLLLEGRG